MYAARAGILGGTRIRDGRMVPVTSDVGRGLDPAATGVLTAPVHGFASDIFTMRRGGMYAARAGILGGTRIRDGRMVSNISDVGRGLDPAVFPGGMGFTGW